MNLKTLSALSVVLLVGSACPPPNVTPDAGPTPGLDGSTTGPCTGGCGPNQICDTVKHVCVDACGGCDAGVCIKNAQGAFQCVAQSTSCNGTVCAQGQSTCIAGVCSCLGFTRASRDTCAVEGQICNASYSPASQTGGACDSPKTYQACKTLNCPSGNCASCPAAHLCIDVFSGLDALCLRQCSTPNDCNSGELCAQFDQGNACLPAGLFRGRGCSNYVPADGGLPDGGWQDAGLVIVAVPPSNTCLNRDQQGNPEPSATANCTYEWFRFSNMDLPYPTCRPAGQAPLFGACKRDWSLSSGPVQCGTGMECMLTRGNEGQCMKMCNATDPKGGFQPEPGCAGDESCVNLYRLEDPNSVVGVCLKKCSVFGSNGLPSSCAAYGSTTASCVPTTPDGRYSVSANGNGVCVPQKATVQAAGQSCLEADPFKGASCQNGLVCQSPKASEVPVCEVPCDLDCVPLADGGSVPTRCASEPNATCAAGKTCTRVTTTSGANLGFCR